MDYRFVSVGKLIRDEINKRTHYSKIIMENLAKYKKINEKILEVLLKNVALQGNFIIQCTSATIQSVPGTTKTWIFGASFSSKSKSN